MHTFCRNFLFQTYIGMHIWILVSTTCDQYFRWSCINRQTTFCYHLDNILMQYSATVDVYKIDIFIAYASIKCLGVNFNEHSQWTSRQHYANVNSCKVWFLIFFVMLFHSLSFQSLTSIITSIHWCSGTLKSHGIVKATASLLDFFTRGGSESNPTKILHTSLHQLTR